MPTKLNLDCKDELWNRVKIFKMIHNCQTMNEAVNRILELGLGDDYQV